MERLTFTDEELERINTDCPVKNDYHIDRFCDNVCDEFQNNCPFMKMAQKLKAYEDKQEQGLLIELPCKVGDTFWEVSWSNDSFYPRVAHSLQHCCYVKDRLGTWCFLTEAEAKEALASIGGLNEL